MHLHLFGLVYGLALLAILAATVLLARSGWVAGRSNGAGGLCVVAAVIEAVLVFGEIIVRGVLPRVFRDVDGTDITVLALDFYVPTAAALHALAIVLIALAVRRLASPTATHRVT